MPRPTASPLVARQWYGKDDGPFIGKADLVQSLASGTDCAASKTGLPEDATMRISHEAICQALYIQGRGALKRELSACLRSG